ncbi:hypothetical protein BH10BAC5_BH10BAC5_03440 [soil metagenome]
MGIKIIEIKAHCSDPSNIENILTERKADFRGIDNQTDTYFNCKNGRLKLREGTIENSLIHYNRADLEGPKRSDVKLIKIREASEMKSILSETNGILKTVIKRRKIFFIRNVKFHIDEIENLGSFVEIEAIDESEQFTENELLEQCNYYLSLFNIPKSDLLKKSYSDMI